jgi:hypothetical protein
MADTITIRMASVTINNTWGVPVAVPSVYTGAYQATFLNFKGSQNVNFQIGTLSEPSMSGTGVGLGSVLYPRTPVGARQALYVSVLTDFNYTDFGTTWKAADGVNSCFGYIPPNNRLWVGTPSVGVSNAVSIGGSVLDFQNTPGITNTATTQDGITVIGRKCASSFSQPNTTAIGQETLIQLRPFTTAGVGPTAVGNSICNFVDSTGYKFASSYFVQSTSVILGHEACKVNKGNYVAIGNKAARGTDAFFGAYALRYAVPEGEVVAIGHEAQMSIKPWGYPTIEGEGQMMSTFQNVVVGWNAFKNSLWVNNATVVGAAAGLQTTTNTGKADDNVLVQDLSFRDRPYFGGAILIGSQADWANRITKDIQTPNLVVGRSSTTSTDTSVPIASNLYLGLGRPSVVRTAHTNSVFIGYYDDITAGAAVNKNLYIKTYGSNALLQSNANGAIAFVLKPSPTFYDYGVSGARLRSSGTDYPPGWGIPNSPLGASGTFQINENGVLKTVTVTDGSITSIS